MAGPASTSNVPLLINTTTELSKFISTITPSCSLYFDLEGSKLSRNGTLSLLTILTYPQKATHILDILTLGVLAFTTPSPSGATLKSILEDSTIPKYVWDVRNDADALWALYKVSLKGVTDIQLLENASRPDDRKFVRGLDVCVQHDLKLTFKEREGWLKTKKVVKGLMPYAVFDTRPLSDKTVEYCVGDVAHLPALRDVYLKRIKGEWLDKAMVESEKRVVEAQSEEYDPQSEKKRLGPWGSAVLTVERMCELMEEAHDEALMNVVFGKQNDVGYYDYDDEDWGGNNAADGAMDSEAFYSCWDKN